MKDNQIGEGMARGISSSRMGKLTEEVRTKIDIDTRDELRRLAGDAGMSESEFLRELVMIRVRGFDHVQRVLRERMYVVAGIAEEERD